MPQSKPPVSLHAKSAASPAITPKPTTMAALGSGIVPASTTARGRIAEGLAAAYLETAGYRILARNWRNRWCELDIIARLERNSITEVHFIEVKYRRNTAFGYAAEYISRDKSARLIRAALAWTQTAAYNGPYQIGVVTIEGDLQDPVIAYLPGCITGS